MVHGSPIWNLTIASCSHMFMMSCLVLCLWKISLTLVGNVQCALYNSFPLISAGISESVSIRRLCQDLEARHRHRLHRQEIRFPSSYLILMWYYYDHRGREWKGGEYIGWERRIKSRTSILNQYEIAMHYRLLFFITTSSTLRYRNLFLNLLYLSSYYYTYLSRISLIVRIDAKMIHAIKSQKQGSQKYSHLLIWLKIQNSRRSSNSWRPAIFLGTHHSSTKSIVMFHWGSFQQSVINSAKKLHFAFPTWNFDSAFAFLS